MRISDWSSDVCSSDLGGTPDARFGGWKRRPWPIPLLAWPRGKRGMELWCRSLDRDLGPVPANGNGALRSARRLIRAQPVQDRREFRGRPALHHIGIVPITRVDLGSAQLRIHPIPPLFAEAVQRPGDGPTTEN